MTALSNEVVPKRNTDGASSSGAFALVVPWGVKKLQDPFRDLAHSAPSTEPRMIPFPARIGITTGGFWRVLPRYRVCGQGRRFRFSLCFREAPDLRSRTRLRQPSGQGRSVWPRRIGTRPVQSGDDRLGEHREIELSLEQFIRIDESPPVRFQRAVWHGKCTKTTHKERLRPSHAPSCVPDPSPYVLLLVIEAQAILGQRG